ncbi:hypothetical protein Barb7_03229 [Bacteroidales bacterium Barb7]|nr:hypothetical protein Barb7_03229 [Bacteroidales bacterium Barb7]
MKVQEQVGICLNKRPFEPCIARSNIRTSDTELAGDGTFRLAFFLQIMIGIHRIPPHDIQEIRNLPIQFGITDQTLPFVFFVILIPHPVGIIPIGGGTVVPVLPVPCGIGFGYLVQVFHRLNINVCLIPLAEQRHDVVLVACGRATFGVGIRIISR